MIFIFMFIFSKLHTTSNNTWTSKRQNQWWSHQRRSRPIWKLCPSYVLVFIYSKADFDLSFLPPAISYHLCLFHDPFRCSRLGFTLISWRKPQPLLLCTFFLQSPFPFMSIIVSFVVIYDYTCSLKIIKSHIEITSYVLIWSSDIQFE